MSRNSNHGLNYLANAIDTYYQYNPDTLMPLLMLALAAQGKLEITNEVKKGRTVFASIDIGEVMGYEWVRLNAKLKKRLREDASKGIAKICSVGTVPAELESIYETFHHYDTETVVQEYHHRKGILVNHSSNLSSDNALRQYATIFLTEELLLASADSLQRDFLFIANSLLEKSGIQPPRPRIQVARALCALLDYDGKGVVYNPFAGCAIAGAMIGAGKNLYADGDKNDKLLAAARLLCYGTGQKGFNIELRDSTKWVQGVKPDYVISTFLGYAGGKSAFDLCLSHCLDDFNGTGKFAGIAAPKSIFENQSSEMKEALRRDWVDSIVLLPFGEVAVLIDAAKPENRKKQVRFYNLTNPLMRRRPIHLIIGEDLYAEILRLSDVKKKGFLKALVVPEIDQEEGCELISLGDIFEKMPRKTWPITRVNDRDNVLARIDRSTPYDEWGRIWMQGIEKDEIISLFAPAYKMDEDCLIVNSKGDLEPRLFDAAWGNAFFQDGYAFRRKSNAVFFDYEWLIHELCSQTVSRQLHPYGKDDLIPEAFSEDQVLALKLNRPLPVSKEEDDANDKLEPGMILLGSDNNEYTVHRFLGNGNFGYAYTAKSRNLTTGEDKEVVIKEFFPHYAYHREENRVVPNSEFDEMEYAEDRVKFKKEAEIMGILGNMPDSHIVPAIGFFECETTDTMYYVMPFYSAGSFDDFLMADERMTEPLAIQHIVIPLCKALNASQKHKILHLDIKPENVLIDENGDAALTDYGTAKVYDESGMITFRGGKTSGSPFAAPELVNGSMTKYDPRPDMFGIAGTIFSIVTGEFPQAIVELDQEVEDCIRTELKNAQCGKQFTDAIVMGLQASMSLRPKNAQAFLNLFPGCEDIKL